MHWEKRSTIHSAWVHVTPLPMDPKLCTSSKRNQVPESCKRVPAIMLRVTFRYLYIHSTSRTSFSCTPHPSTASLHRQSSSSDMAVPLLVHRFANGVPMLDTNMSSACALVAGVSKAGWRSLGFKILASRVMQSDGRLRFILSEAPTPLKVVLFCGACGVGS